MGSGRVGYRCLWTTESTWGVFLEVDRTLSSASDSIMNFLYAVQRSVLGL